MLLDSSGNLLVGQSSSALPGAGNTTTGISVSGQYDALFISRAAGSSAVFNRNSDGDIVQFRKDGTAVGSISTSGRMTMFGTNGSTGAGWYFGSNVLLPLNHAGALVDNAIDLGQSNIRFDDAFITNGVTTGSDRTEKQDIAALSSTEMLVAARISKTFHTYRWKDAVVAKGDDARIHTGTIAQEVQAAFTAESLDAGRYAMFMSDTWWDHDVDVAAVEASDAVDAVYREVTDSDGLAANEVVTESKQAIEAADAYTRTDSYYTEDAAPSGSTKKTRLGIRYPELLSFLAAYNEQRFASIETRLTALEG